MELRGEDELGVALLNPPLADVYAQHKQQGTPMPMAVAVGIDPLTFCAFALKGSPQVDKLAIAGGLRGSPVEVTTAAHTGIPIPALAEFLLEGEIDPTDERKDGPLGEIGGYSMAFPATPTFRVRRITHRVDPIYHALLPTGPEGDLLLATVAEASIASRVAELFPFARRYHFVPSTFGSSLVVQVAPAPRAQVRSLLVHLVTLGMVKKVVAVADDVDPYDPVEVEWSVATRCQPDQDGMILSDLKGHVIDPSCPKLFHTAKLALDATGYERVRGAPAGRPRPGRPSQGRNPAAGKDIPWLRNASSSASPGLVVPSTASGCYRSCANWEWRPTWSCQKVADGISCSKAIGRWRTWKSLHP